MKQEQHDWPLKPGTMFEVTESDVWYRWIGTPYAGFFPKGSMIMFVQVVHDKIYQRHEYMFLWKDKKVEVGITVTRDKQKEYFYYIFKKRTG